MTGVRPGQRPISNGPSTKPSRNIRITVAGGDTLADLRVKMEGCRVDKEGRLNEIEEWKKTQNSELKMIRKNGTKTLTAIILLLIGVVVNLALAQTHPAQDVPAAVETAIEEQLPTMIESIVQQVLDSTSTP